MGINSKFWFISLAASGGLLVFFGLLLEQSAEKSWFKNLKDLNRAKARKLWGNGL